MTNIFTEIQELFNILNIVESVVNVGYSCGITITVRSGDTVLTKNIGDKLNIEFISKFNANFSFKACVDELLGWSCYDTLDIVPESNYVVVHNNTNVLDQLKRKQISFTLSSETASAVDTSGVIDVTLFDNGEVMLNTQRSSSIYKNRVVSKVSWKSVW